MGRFSKSDAVLKELRAFGLGFPGTHTKSPWPGHLDLAVKDKTFAYLSLEGEPLGISCKLPQSCTAALLLPGTEPTGYGLGKSGWVSAKFPEGKDLPVQMLKEWIVESYKAQAPKKLAQSIDDQGRVVGAAGKGAPGSQGRSGNAGGGAVGRSQPAGQKLAAVRALKAKAAKPDPVSKAVPARSAAKRAEASAKKGIRPKAAPTKSVAGRPATKRTEASAQKKG